MGNSFHPHHDWGSSPFALSLPCSADACIGLKLMKVHGGNYIYLCLFKQFTAGFVPGGNWSELSTNTQAHVCTHTHTNTHTHTHTHTNTHTLVDLDTNSISWVTCPVQATQSMLTKMREVRWFSCEVLVVLKKKAKHCVVYCPGVSYVGTWKGVQWNLLTNQWYLWMKTTKQLKVNGGGWVGGSQKSVVGVEGNDWW